MKELNVGDTLVIWRLDRLGRSLKHLIEIVEELKGRGVGFRSINDGGIDTTTASGEMVFNIFATLPSLNGGSCEKAGTGTSAQLISTS